LGEGVTEGVEVKGTPERDCKKDGKLGPNSKPQKLLESERVEDTGGVFLTKAMKKKLKKTRKKQSKNDGAPGGVPNLPNIYSETGKIPQACD
jgi:hypothetical protein